MGIFRRNIFLHLLAVTGVLLLGAPALAQEDEGTAGQEAAPTTANDSGWPEIIPTSAFASRASMFDAKLSPDGSKFAYQTSIKERSIIAIFDADTRETLRLIDVGGTGNMKWFKWAGNERILFSLHSNGYAKGRSFLFLFLPATRLMVHDLTSSDTHFIGLEGQGLEGDDVLYIDPAGRHILLSLSEKIARDPSVYRFPLDGSGEGAAVLVQKRRKGIDEWWADTKGNVRLGMRWRGRSKVSFYYRGSVEEKLTEVAKIKLDGEEIDSWDVLSVREGSDIGLALVEDARGFNVLREFDYRTGAAGKLVYAHPEWGLDGAIMNAAGEVDGAGYTDEAPRVEWFDPDLKKTQRQLEKALGSGRVRILDYVKNERMLIWHGAANDPGLIYVFTPKEKRLDLFDQLRPDIDFEQLAETKTVYYQTRDNVRIESYLTLPRAPTSGNFPLIILPHGGPYGVRDMRVYNDEVQLLANRGYAVLQPNFRGSGGYGESFATLGNGQIGRKMQDDLDDAMDWAVAEGHADPKRVCVVGGSYGGYAALWAVIRNPERYRCAASWAGVTDLEEQLKFDSDHSSRVNSRRTKRWKRKVEGEEDDFDLDDVSPARQIRRLTRPVLVAHGTSDGTVPFSQFTELREASEKYAIPIEKLVVNGSGHSFGKAEHEQKWYDTLMSFLVKHNPPDRPLPIEEPANEDGEDENPKEDDTKEDGD